MKYPKLVLPKPADKSTVIVDPSKFLKRVCLEYFLKYGKVEDRTGGSFEGKAFYLDDTGYDWVLGMDDEECLCLIPLKKS